MFCSKGFVFHLSSSSFSCICQASVFCCRVRNPWMRRAKNLSFESCYFAVNSFNNIRQMHWRNEILLTLFKYSKQEFLLLSVPECILSELAFRR